MNKIIKFIIDIVYTLNILYLIKNMIYKLNDMLYVPSFTTIYIILFVIDCFTLVLLLDIFHCIIILNVLTEYKFTN